MSERHTKHLSSAQCRLKKAARFVKKSEFRQRWQMAAKPARKHICLWGGGALPTWTNLGCHV